MLRITPEDRPCSGRRRSNWILLCPATACGAKRIALMKRRNIFAQSVRYFDPLRGILADLPEGIFSDGVIAVAAVATFNAMLVEM